MTETEKLRHYCRNTHCRTKLEAPVENEHHAFCCRFCFESFYRSRCRVCEKALRNARLTYCRPPNGCKAEARKWPGKYAFPSSGVPQAVFCTASESYADSTGLGFGLRPHHKCLREWIWGSDGENDHSLYDRDGLTVARVALDGGRYHLRSPIAQPTAAPVMARSGTSQAGSGVDCARLLAARRQHGIAKQARQ